jgi:solute carrier family 25 phosphate transporter 23/24/25/41
VVTHPLDNLRLRMTVSPRKLATRETAAQIWREGGVRAMYRGFWPSLLSLCPFIGINFMVFDALKDQASSGLFCCTTTAAPQQRSDNNGYRNHLPIHGTLAMGALAGLTAQTVCYPLDTVKRKLQLQRSKDGSRTMGNMMMTIWRKEGVRGFYSGVTANAIKIVPGNAVRFWVYTSLQTCCGLT